MRYFSIGEILLSCIVFFIFGASCGLAYFILFASKSIGKKILLCPIYVLKSKSFSPDTTHRAGRLKKITAHIIDSVYEFCFLIFVGIVYIILLYVCCDGVFRVYPLSIAICTAYLSYRVISLCLDKATNKLLRGIYILEYSVLYATTYPARYLILLLLEKIRPVRQRILNKIKNRKFKKQSNKKSTEQALILKNILINPKKTEGKI